MAQTNQVPQNSTEIQQQVSILNARMGNVNLAYSDLLREINNTFKIMMETVDKLQKENAELKGKSKELLKNNKVK